MENVVHLTTKEKEDFFRLMEHFPILGIGSEGTCYQHGNIATKIYNGVDEREYDWTEIITTRDISLPSFAFPDKLYVWENKLVGYDSRIVESDYFSYENDKMFQEKKLIEAIKQYLIDIEILSEEHIFTYELPFNLMFDGIHLVGIDTPSYKKMPYNPYVRNIQCLKAALQGAMLWKRQTMSFKTDEIVEDLAKEKVKKYRIF